MRRTARSAPRSSAAMRLTRRASAARAADVAAVPERGAGGRGASGAAAVAAAPARGPRVRAASGAVAVARAGGAPLYQSKPLVGSGMPVSTGEIALPAASGAARRLVLVAENATPLHPAGGDRLHLPSGAAGLPVRPPGNAQSGYH